MRDFVQSLWVGRRLSTMEQLAISSFLHHGHGYHLYTYEPVENLPPGAVELDAETILPASAQFQYEKYKTFSGFSNFFRYKLLLEKGGWWVDTDVVCLRPFDFTTPYVFSSEHFGELEVPASAVLKAPAQCAAMRQAWEVCQAKDVTRLKWGETGPALVAQMIERFSLQEYVQPASVFCPLSPLAWRTILTPGGSLASLAGSHALHIWNEMWRRNSQEKEAAFDPTCIYEQLIGRYLSRSGASPVAALN